MIITYQRIVLNVAATVCLPIMLAGFVTTPKDTERTDFTPIRPQPPLPNQQGNRDKR